MIAVHNTQFMDFVHKMCVNLVLFTVDCLNNHSYDGDNDVDGKSIRELNYQYSKNKMCYADRFGWLFHFCNREEKKHNGLTFGTIFYVPISN